MIEGSGQKALAILQTHNLIKRYGDFEALAGVSLSVCQGDIYGLVGRNGAGKTTFFKCVMGLARPSSGEIVIGGSQPVQRAGADSPGGAGDGRGPDSPSADRVGGADSRSKPSAPDIGPASLNKARRRMGFMISPSFLPYLNAAENLRYHCRVRGIQDHGEVARLLQLVDLNGVKKPFRAFSLGMKNRLGIAAALLGSPEIVVLDEPVNGLDPQGIIDMRSVIRDVHERSGATFLISSHILAELDLVATRFGFIEQGVLLKEITHADLHEQTKKTLRIEVDDAVRAQAALAALGVDTQAHVDLLAGRYGLTLSSHLESTPEIAQALVSAGVRIFDLHRQETTLEDYFVRLVGGYGQTAGPVAPAAVLASPEGGRDA